MKNLFALLIAAALLAAAVSWLTAGGTFLFAFGIYEVRTSWAAVFGIVALCLLAIVILREVIFAVRTSWSALHRHTAASSHATYFPATARPAPATSPAIFAEPQNEKAQLQRRVDKLALDVHQLGLNDARAAALLSVLRALRQSPKAETVAAVEDVVASARQAHSSIETRI